MKTFKLLFVFSAFVLGLFTSCSDDDKSSTPKDYEDVYYMDTYDAQLYKLSIGTLTTTAVKDLTGMTGPGIAYDSKNDMIIFSDYEDEDTPNGKIWRMKPDGTGAEELVTGLLNPFGISIDSKNGKIYWGDEEGNVSRCNLDGTNIETGVVNIDGGYIRAVAIDGTNKKIYFYEVNNNSLYRANLDGTSASVILEGYYGYAIAVDATNGKIYFDAQTDDESVSALYRANLDGSSPTLVDDTQSRIYGIAVDNEKGKVYWSARDTYEIYKANLNGTEKEIIATDLGEPRGICLR
ncbi:MAG: DUF5050 domain-containing protein [Breznakibacter sp.]